LNEKEKIRKVLGRYIPLWEIIPLLIALIAVSFAAGITVNQTRYSNVFGEVVDVVEEVTVTSGGMSVASANEAAVGNTSGTAVVMSTIDPEARTTITKAHWVYKVQITCINATTPADTTFKVDLYVGDTLNATLYVKSDADPIDTEMAACRFDIGSALSTNEAYMIIVSTV